MDDKVQEAVYERTSNRRHNRTCEWILNEPQLKSWIKDDARRLCLWLEGKPGAGALLLYPTTALMLILLFKAKVLCVHTSFKGLQAHRV
jgi:hypothetical protein